MGSNEHRFESETLKIWPHPLKSAPDDDGYGDVSNFASGKQSVSVRGSGTMMIVFIAIQLNHPLRGYREVPISENETLG